MKLVPFIFAASAGIASASPVAQLDIGSLLGGSGSGSSGFLSAVLGQFGATVGSTSVIEGPVLAGSGGPAQPHTAVPAGVNIEPRLETQAKKDGGQRVSINYGPFLLPAGGMISRPQLGAKTPCSNCFITAMQARIKYQDGKDANIDSGAWLHHMVITKGVNPIFASGNERTPLRVNNHLKYGIEMGAADTFMMLVDLMSNARDNKNVILEMTYEYIPRAQANGYKDVYMRWNDVGQPAAKNGVYSFKTFDWSSPVSGRLLYTNGHVHDGGTDTRLLINNREVCRSTMLYGRRPGFSESGGATATSGDGHAHSGSLHISDSSTCQNFGDIKVGDRMSIEAWYDSNKYPLMEHNGQKERLMGIMRVYIGT